MKVNIYQSNDGSIYCYPDYEPRDPAPDELLIQTIEAEETENPRTTSWKVPNSIEIGEVFSCVSDELMVRIS